MRKYLATLPNRSDAHKKRFAFLFSSSFTALMFIVWAVANFGLPGGSNVKMAVVEEKKEERVVKVSDVSASPSPIATLKGGIAGAVVAAGPYLIETKEYVAEMDFESSYNEMRSSAFQKYGR